MNAPGRPLITVIVPCYNEEQVVKRFYESAAAVFDSQADACFRLLFVDDGSRDATLEKLNAIAARDGRVGVCSLSRNFGHQVALSAGLDAAAGEAVVMMDGDLQHPPELIPEMIRLWREGHDVVSAVRRTTRGTSLAKRLSSSAFYTVINRLSETNVMPGAADFCLLSRRAYVALRSMPERHRFLRGMVAWIGFPRAFVPFIAPPRAAGESKYTLWKMIGLALDAVFSFSAAPMKLGTRAGAAVSLLGFIYLAYILARHVLLGDLVPGWGSLASAVLILGGVQLGFMGMMGGYLARVFEEAKGRPLYLLKQRPQWRDRGTIDESAETDESSVLAKVAALRDELKIQRETRDYETTNPQSPIPNPQSPIPNPQSPIPNPQSLIPNP